MERPRGSHLARRLGAHCDEYRRNPTHFNFTLYRDGRPVADLWSATGEHHDIGARLFIDLTRDLRSRLLIHFLESHRITHVAYVLWSYRRDKTFTDELAQRLDRKNYVDVGVRIAVIVVMMGNHQVGNIHIAADNAKREIAEIISNIERTLIPSMHTRRADECDRCSGELALERRKRHTSPG